MKLNFAHILIVAAAMIPVTSYAAAAAKDKFDLGKREFESKCALCHGKSGKGDGGVTDLLKKAPPDLTLLSRKNGGVFPFERVSAVIDGREWIKGHGERDMPFWGAEYKQNQFVPPNTMSMSLMIWKCMLGLAYSLIDYLNRLQAK